MLGRRLAFFQRHSEREGRVRLGGTGARAGVVGNVVLSACCRVNKRFFCNKSIVEHHLYKFGEFMGHVDVKASEKFMEPVKVDFDGYNIESVASCWLSSFFITDNGMLFSWGLNEFSQSGYTGNTNKVIRVPHWLRIIETVRPIQVAAGRAHTVALTSDGNLLSWGSLEFGQLGTGAMEQKASVAPQTIAGSITEHKVIEIAAGLDHTVALTEKGDVYTWGFNREGQLGLGFDDDDVPVPTHVKGLPPIKRIYSGSDFSAALTEDGDYYMWGGGELFQLGNGEQDVKLEPQRLSLKGEKVIDMALSTISGLLMTESGSVYSWGTGSYGQLGHGDETNYPKPKLIEEFKGKRIVKASGKGSHYLALSEDGVLYSWGYAAGGRIGTGDETDIYVPTPIPFFKNKKIRTFACGIDHGLVVASE